MKKKGNKKLRTASYILVVMAIVCTVVGFVIYNYVSASYEGKQVRVYVDASKGESALRDSLTLRLGDDYGNRVFTVWSKMSAAASLQSGSYVVEPGEPAWKLARRIKNQRQNPVKVTFNNLRTMERLAQSLDRQLLADSISIAQAINAQMVADGVAREAYPAHFLPDTYEFYWTETPENVVKKITAHYASFWDDTRRAKAAALGLSPDEVATLASIVEEETNKADERPVVARLYLNRLSRDMKLQADPTVKFALGDFSLKRILNKHLEVQSPYNTYISPGLPPGPIRIPQASTLDAVLDAPSHNYIYMCAKEDFSGYHNFATDYATHQANAKKYREALDSNGY